VAVEELLLYFLLLPALGYVIGAVWLRRAMRNIAQRELGFLREPGINVRYLVIAQIFAIPTVFGILLLVQLLGVREGTVKDSVARALGWTFSAAAILTVLSEAWIFVRWRASAFRENFARTLVLAVIPESVITFVLIVGIQIVARLGTGSSTNAESLTRAAQWMLLGSLSAPLGAFLGNRASTLNEKTFGRILIRAVLGEPLAVVCLVLAFLELAKR